jgi:histone acetyltransferase (RNA polymerase elongator complex component)
MSFSFFAGSTFGLPASKRRNTAVIPVFLPFFGCKRRCIFCAQHAQTGQGDAPLQDILDAADRRLARRAEAGLPPPELAFYGGTFTSMPLREQTACLEFAVRALGRKRIRAFRCSTRPDAVDAAAISRLRAAGCATVELGVQSFSDFALEASERGYDAAAAASACARVKAAGFALGVQLLPGMPGVSTTVFLEDVRNALRAGADMLRFYPCLVLSGTKLAGLWRAKTFQPWDIDACIAALAEGWLLAGEAGVPVIRVGLAQEPSLAGAVLAGPAHPALGARVMGRALLLHVARCAKNRPLAGVDLPRACQGYFWGHKGELRREWAALGLTPETVRFTNEDVLRLYSPGRPFVHEFAD